MFCSLGSACADCACPGSCSPSDAGGLDGPAGGQPPQGLQGPDPAKGEGAALPGQLLVGGAPWGAAGGSWLELEERAVGREVGKAEGDLKGWVRMACCRDRTFWSDGE